MNRWHLLHLIDGRQCLVDEIDLDWIHRYTWNTLWKPGCSPDNNRYVRRTVGRQRRTVYLHREILMRADPREPEFVAAHIADHINRQKLDARRCNLRWATRAENNGNRGLYPTLDEIMAAHPNPPEFEIPF